MAIGEVVRIFNRTPHTLSVTKDGRQRRIPSGYSHMTSDLVFYARTQNPVPGTEDPNTLAFESLISRVMPEGVPQVDPLDEVPDDILASLPKERIDRSRLAPDRQVAEEVHMAHFPRGRVGVENPTEGMSDPGKFGDAG